ncbi:MAG: hypothetical protein ACI4XR_00295, partial [Bacilli bacterium]
MQIVRGYNNNYGGVFPNIVNVSFSSITEFKNFTGELLKETKKEKNIFVTQKDEYDGIYLYKIKNLAENDYAFRIYRDFEKYSFRRHYDDYLIDKLQQKQKNIKEIDFPIGVATIENYVIGQVIYLYENSQTAFEYLHSIKNNQNFEKKYYELLYKILNLIKMLYDNEIYYIDVHPNNFLILENGDIKIIDFENHSIDLSKDGVNYLKNNLLYIIN